MKSQHRGIHPAAVPSGEGCVECLNSKGWWLHLRRCAECGHIGCCDSSPSQHASKHFQETGHPIIASFEPGETWFYSYETQETIHGEKLAAPRWHSENQPVPGPEGSVPKDWQSRLH
jgi:uncharacterized UBP type Zn finger protein